MTTMTLRLSSEDAQLVRKYAEFEGLSISDFIRESVFERIEDQEDLAGLRVAMQNDDGKRFSHEEVLDELGF